MCGIGKYTQTPQISLPERKLINFWNIHGQFSKLLGDKFRDDEFLKICNSYDILCLAEIHTISTPNISFKLLKQKTRKKIIQAPKYRGVGLAVFVKKDMSNMVTPLNNCHEDSIWIKVKKEESGEVKDIYIGTAHISPSDKTNKNVSLEKLFEEVQVFQEKGIVFVQGDLNARTSTSPDYIIKDKTDENFCIENHEKPLSRNSEDTPALEVPLY